MAASFAVARESDGDGDEFVEIKALTPPPSYEEEGFWQTGEINIVRPDGLVIDDMGFRWSRSGTRFQDKDGNILNAGDFREGMRVTFVLDDEFNEIITLIKGEVRKPDKN